MKAFENRPGLVDANAIDRLVDGELAESERRELLLRLESDPEGWRRCALAFLEDQAWRKALATASPACSTPARSPSLALPAPARSAKARLRWASIAATILASAFAGGFAARGLTKATPRVEIAEAIPSGSAVAPSPDRTGEIREVGSLELVDGSAGESPPQRFPIRSGPGLDDRWLRSQPSSVPDYVRSRWERQGYQVAERRKLMSVELGDGRHVAIPVDEVKLDYVGQQPL